MKNGIEKITEEIVGRITKEVDYYSNGKLETANAIIAGIITELSIKKFLIDKHLTDNEKNG